MGRTLFPTFRSKDYSWYTYLKIYGRSHIYIFSPVSILIQFVRQGSVVRSRFGAHSRLSGMKIFGCHGIKSGLALFRTTRPRLLLFLRRCHILELSSLPVSVCCTRIKEIKWTRMENLSRFQSQEASMEEYHKSWSWSRWVPFIYDRTACKMKTAQTFVSSASSWCR